MAANTGNRDNKNQHGGHIGAERRALAVVGPATVTVALQAETKRKRAFAALAMAGGCYAEAVRAVDDLKLTALKGYVKNYPEEYEEVRRNLAPQIEAAVVEEMRAFIVQAGRVKSKVLERIDRALDEDKIPERDLHQTLRNVAASQSTAVDKTLSLSGRPSQITEHRSAAELLERLQKLGALKRPGHDAESTAIEVPAESG
jgi:hypothetical protein